MTSCGSANSKQAMLQIVMDNRRHVFAQSGVVAGWSYSQKKLQQNWNLQGKLLERGRCNGAMSSDPAYAVQLKSPPPVESASNSRE